MYPPNFDYARAGSVQEAVGLLQGHSEAKLLAGGHSLIPLLKLRQASADMLVDIGRIPELKGIGTSNGFVRIGALTTHAHISASDLLPVALREAAGDIGDWQVRNRGTIGGNVSHADPASDHPTVLSALGATFYIAGAADQRFLPAENFFTGMFETNLGKHEVLTAIEVHAQRAGTGSAYVKLSNPASGYAMLGVAAVISLEGEKCTSASVTLGGLTPRPTRAPSVEAALTGKKIDDATLAAAAKAVSDDLKGEVIGDIHTSAEYRKAVAPVFVRRALSKAVERARK